MNYEQNNHNPQPYQSPEYLLHLRGPGQLHPGPFYDLQGNNGWITEIRRMYDKAYYERNKDKFKIWHKAYRKSHKKQIRASNELYREAHPEIVKAWRTAYYKANKERLKIVLKTWREVNPEKSRDQGRKRRVLKRTTKIEPINEKIVFMRDGWICQHCKKRADKRFKHPNPMCASLDHIIPLSEGGTHTYANVQLAHLGCNSSKGNNVLPQGEQLRLC